MAIKYDTLLTNCGLIVGFVSKYIPFLLNITFLSLPCQYVFICKSDFVISSPEHEVLMVSYCGQWLSVVRRRATCVVRRASSVNI